MKHDRITAMGIVAALTLTACGGESGDSTSDEAAAPPAAAPAAAPAAGGGMDLPDGVTVEMVTQGQDLFHGRATCFACHGQDGTGSQLGPGFTDQEWLWADGSYESIIEQINVGTNEPKQYPGIMLPRAGIDLSDEEVAAIGAYVYSLSQG